MKKLNLGCGVWKRPDCINVDFRKEVEPDVVHDLNVFPYPFADDSFDVIEASHVLEHLDRPFVVMKELHRILKPGGLLHLKVPHFSRGMTHAEHKSGFDLMFPYYFDKRFVEGGYYGVDFTVRRVELHWMAFFHLMRNIGIPKSTILVLRVVNAIMNFLAALAPRFCARVWCFAVGGFEEIEFEFICEKPGRAA